MKKDLDLRVLMCKLDRKKFQSLISKMTIEERHYFLIRLLQETKKSWTERR
jgi:hypothetical protein